MASFCSPDNHFCVYGEVVGQDAHFTIHAAANGWAAFGIGKSMQGADIYVGWKGSTPGRVILSRRTATGYSVPQMASNQSAATLLPLQKPAPSWAILAFSFARPLTEMPVIGPASSFIYALSDAIPRQPALASSVFREHSQKGVISALNILGSVGGSTNGQSSRVGNGQGAQVTASCIDGSVFCLYGAPDGKGNVIFTVHAASKGWAGVALGTAMANADFYVGWKNSTGGYSVSRRSPNNRQMPSPSSSQIASIVSLQVAAPTWATLAFSFSRPIQPSSGVTLANNSPFIYAYSDAIPSSLDSIQSSFTIHKDYGSLPTANFLSATPGSSAVGSGSSNKAIISSTPDVYHQVLLAHGILFFIAWGLAPFAGIFIARFLKNRLGPLWYKLHLGIFVSVTGLFSVISFILIILYKRPAHFRSKHTIIGLVVMIALVCQISLGYVINALWSPDRKEIPIQDKIHWWLGRSLFILALANIYIGINEFNELGYIQGTAYVASVVIYSLVIAIGFAILIYGQFKIGQTHETDESKPHDSFLAGHEEESRF